MFDFLKTEMLKDPVVRAAYHAKGIYRIITDAIRKGMNERKMCAQDLVDASAVDPNAVEDVLNGDCNLHIPLNEHVGMLDALGLEIVIDVRPKKEEDVYGR